MNLSLYKQCMLTTCSIFYACQFISRVHLILGFMYSILPKACLAAAFICTATVSIATPAVDGAEVDEDRFARLEARVAELESRLSETEKKIGQAASTHSEEREEREERIAELEARLAKAEQDATTVKQEREGLSTVDDKSLLVDRSDTKLSNRAWNNPKWMEPAQWAKIQPGLSKTQVIELLGEPPRSVQSLKPRIDEVFYYQTGLQTGNDSLLGKVSFRKEKVVLIRKPDFDSNNDLD